MTHDVTSASGSDWQTITAEEVKEAGHEIIEATMKIAESSLTEQLLEFTKDVVYPWITKACKILDILGVSPPETEMDKSPQEQLDESLEGSIETVSAKTCRVVERGAIQSFDGSVSSTFTLRDYMLSWFK